MFAHLNLSEDSDTFAHERHLHRLGYRRVAGTDEAGRGPLAGPVVAACVVLPEDINPAPFRDSKILSAKKREQLAAHLRQSGAAIGVGLVEAAEIDRINILKASLLAMRLALDDLRGHYPRPDFLLIDGIFTIDDAIPQCCLKKGETKSASIAAASIIAKTVRDGIMLELDRRYPRYNFAQHKGYPTKAHYEKLRQWGACPEHRRSFRGVKGES
ncbi:MAG: ribonuclease HII [Desulfobulbaceae bacterium]|jgi:ribonuclease HII|nr:ribonuclease HII [Desulfobulbaceae bacterium]